MGKNKRKAWRKAKIEDVEETLEDERLVNKMKRQAGKGKATGDAHELFTVDTAGSGAGLPARTRREIARAKLFPPKGPNLGLSAYEEFKIARAESQMERKAPSAKAPEVFDLWTGKTKEEELKEQRVDSTVRLLPQTTALNVPRRLHERVTEAPAVVPAHEGQSVNPLGEAYEEVACLAAARELEREQEEEAMERTLKPVTHELRDFAGDEALREMGEEAKLSMYRSIACSESAEKEAKGPEKGSQEAPGKGSTGKTAKQKKQKSQAQRNREKRRKDIDAKQKQIQTQRKLEKSVGALGSVMKELKEKEEFYKKRAEYRQALRAKRRDRERLEGAVGKCRRIGRTRFSEEAIVVPEVDVVDKSLRAMPLKGCAVKERLSSIIRRGLLPPLPEATSAEVVRRRKRVRMQKTKRKVVSPLLKDNTLLR